MTVTSLVPELNPECDVYRIGTLLEMVREFAFRLFTTKNKRIKICVQQSLGSGALTGELLPLKVLVSSSTVSIQPYTSSGSRHATCALGCESDFGKYGLGRV